MNGISGCHICAVLFVTWFALKFYELSRAEWAVLLLTFAAVISAELFNTAVERLCDKVCLKKDELIKLCKDCAAGAVLVCAIFAVIIGTVLFWTRTLRAHRGVLPCRAGEVRAARRSES